MSEPKRRTADPAATPQVARLGALHMKFKEIFSPSTHSNMQSRKFDSYTLTNFSGVMKEK